MGCGHSFHSGWFEAVSWAIFCLYTPQSASIQYALRHHDGIEIDTSISVIVVSPTIWEAVSFPGRWWHHNDLNHGINSYKSRSGSPPLIFQSSAYVPLVKLSELICVGQMG